MCDRLPRIKWLLTAIRIHIYVLFTKINVTIMLIVIAMETGNLCSSALNVRLPLTFLQSFPVHNTQHWFDYNPCATTLLRQLFFKERRNERWSCKQSCLLAENSTCRVNRLERRRHNTNVWNEGNTSPNEQNISWTIWPWRKFKNNIHKQHSGWSCRHIIKDSFTGCWMPHEPVNC